jgi:hypothetical protein
MWAPTHLAGTFRSDMAGFGKGFMSGLKPPTYTTATTFIA